MSIDLSKAEPSGKMTRVFLYEPDGSTSGFNVTASYLSPALFTEQAEQSKPIKVVNGRKQESDFDLKLFRKNVAQHLLLKAVHKIEGCTVRHLRGMVMLSPESAAKMGGLDQEIPLDPEKISDEDQKLIDEGKMEIKEARARAKALAEGNMMWLYTQAGDFFDFAVKIVSNLEYYQDEEWEKQVANLQLGRATNSAPQ